ncbi:protein GlmU [Desulfobacterium sp. N47]|uniref:protein GlmU n=1 Tax=Desulfobacterium sp. N47 TaxID=3115210 RepID=UPI003F4A1AF6
MKGTIFPDPYNVVIGDEVDPDRISGNRVIVYPGSKIYGSSTLISDGVRIGYEGPVTLESCQVGSEVNLKCGFFKDSVFLKGSVLGYGSHVREGTILEEEASIAHTVGLKQTILFPYVTLGSLINFCDCFMSGGTSRKNHSEVGSSYIHFNYTPSQDKATASLIGDVPKGVMLKQKPIFLGGQGGLVGPCRLTFGTTIAAGTICRKDELRPERLIIGGQIKYESIPFIPGDNRNIKRIVSNNIIYIANLSALMHWYHNVRSQFISSDFPEALLTGLKEKVYFAISERIKRLKELLDKTYDNNTAIDRLWPEMEKVFISEEDLSGLVSLEHNFLDIINSAIKKSGKEYISVIKNLSDEESDIGTQWLQGIVDIKTDAGLKLLQPDLTD